MNKDGSDAATAPLNYSADLAILFEPLRRSEVHSVFAMLQPVHVSMARSHNVPAKTEVPFCDCHDVPIALPSMNNGVQRTLDRPSDRP